MVNEESEMRGRGGGVTVVSEDKTLWFSTWVRVSESSTISSVAQVKIRSGGQGYDRTPATKVIEACAWFGSCLDRRATGSLSTEEIANEAGGPSTRGSGAEPESRFLRGRLFLRLTGGSTSWPSLDTSPSSVVGAARLVPRFDGERDFM